MRDPRDFLRRTVLNRESLTTLLSGARSPQHWLSTGINEFVAAVDAYIRWYNDARIESSPGFLIPAQHRRRRPGRHKPEIVAFPPSGGGALRGKKGVILFEVTGWSDAAGHATVFNGTQCYDHCYFNEPGATYRTDRANFWSLT